MSHVGWWLALWALALFLAALLLNTRHNAFPYFYHPDEGEKVAQLLTGKWNFHHPMLLLTTAKVVTKVAGVAPDEQSFVEAGRWVSAGFTAAAVVALSLLGYAWRGWLAAFAGGGALLLHHQLFELSHYLKEDTALLAGLALTFLAAWHFSQKPTVARAAVLGLGAACALSGKFLGVWGLAIALPILCGIPDGRRWKMVTWFGGAFLATLLVINLPLLLDRASFAVSFQREMRLAVGGQGGTTRSVPHALYWNIFRDNTTPVTWALLLAFLAARWRERRRLALLEWLLIAFPLAYTLALSFSPKSNDRYLLPATAVFTLLAALGVRDGARLLGRWMPRRWAALGLALALVAAQLPRWLRYEAAFQRDDNRELFDYVRTQLPPDAVIARDSRVQLPAPKSRALAAFGPLPQTVLGGKFAGDHGPIAEMRRQGITHAAISESDYGRFFLRGLRAKKDDEESFERRKAFYQELLRDAGEPLFQRDRSTVLYLHPGLRLYRLPEG